MGDEVLERQRGGVICRCGKGRRETGGWGRWSGKKGGDRGVKLKEWSEREGVRVRR